MESTDYTPVWFMRQAGRYMPEYRALRKKYEVLTIAQTPELAAQVSLQPVTALGVDAAILFADIMLVPMAMGVDVKIIDSVGPVIDSPIRTAKDLERMHQFAAADIDYLTKTIQILRSELTIPLIGFSGAPFTLASYLIEGHPTRSWLKTKQLMYEQPALWHELMTKLTIAISYYLTRQVEAGAQAIQLFDSWVGCLSPQDFRSYVLPYNQKIFANLTPAGVPRIIFGTDTGAMLADFAQVDCEVVGLDWRTELTVARQLLPTKALQGNLDPAVLLSGSKVIESKTRHILESFGSATERKGFIFNLGHGVLPEVSVETMKGLVDYVHTF